MSRSPRRLRWFAASGERAASALDAYPHEVELRRDGVGAFVHIGDVAIRVWCRLELFRLARLHRRRQKRRAAYE